MHKWKEHFKIAPLYSILLSFMTAIFVKKDSTAKAIFKAFSFAKLLDMIVLETGVAKKNFRHVLINNSIHLLMIDLATRFKKWIYTDLKTETESSIQE